MLVTKQRIFLIIQLISISRAIAGLIFVCIAFRVELNLVAIILFMYACASDLLDGFLARKYHCESKQGKVLDLFGDKFLTIAFSLYAIASGMPIIPITFIIFREVFLLSIRSLQTDSKSIFKPNRLLGGLTTFPIWLTSFLLLLSIRYIEIDAYYFELAYWFCGIVVVLNLTHKLYESWPELIAEFKKGLNE
ncbi:CDP-alcohol phosphatidyltransferase family protein [Kordia sp.]|uniref:CDP-alcohol phosphatidyltransferase family protein n=1 Tax=Kordia sp. TaxID=1965332 RepID=UPI003D6C3DDB